MKYNRAIIHGDGNHTFQDITNSTLTINQITKEVAEFVDYFREQNRLEKTLNIIVLASTKNSIEEDEVLKKLEIEPFFGHRPCDWKPFGKKESILNLLIDYGEKSGLEINVSFIENFDISLDEEFETDLIDEIRQETILILDAFALTRKLNRNFAKIFNDRKIGGCIIPICQNHLIGSKSCMIKTHKDVLKHLNNLFYSRFRRDLIHVELNVPTKEDLFRRLTNIAVKQLGLNPPKKKTKLQDKFQSKAVTNQHSDIQQ